MQTLTLPQWGTTLSLEYTLLNNTIDILNLKSKELGTSTSITSMGDSNGFGTTLRIGITDDLMLVGKYSTNELEYLSDTMKNTKEEFFFRYHIYDDPLAFFNSGFSIDIGYTHNLLEDFYLKDISAINQMIKRVLPNQNASLLYSDGVNPFPNEPFPRPQGYYAKFNNLTSPLSQLPYISMTDTEDTSYYIRALTGFYNDSSTSNFYVGYKETAIKNKISTTPEILLLAQAAGYNLNQVLDRDEKMLFLGFNHSISSGDFIYEFNYEYERFLRTTGLDYINFNHVINASISYLLRKDTLASVGMKYLHRQFNGEIPYLYNTYTQTTFDHKYGYATFSLQYNF